MTIIIGNPPTTVDPEGDVVLTPPAGGNVNLADDTGEVQLSTSSSGIDVTNRLSSDSLSSNENYATADISTDWGVSISSAGPGNGLGGTTAGDAQSFTGDAYRIRVSSNTNSGFIIENAIGFPLFEINSASARSFCRGRIKTTTDGWGFVHESLDGVSGGIQATDTQLIIGSESNHDVGISAGGNAPALKVTTGDDVRSIRDLYIGRRAYVNEYIEFRDDDDNRLRIDTAQAGFNIRAVDNPTDGEPILGVYSASGARRLGVEHAGAVTTSNSEIRVGTDAVGAGGNIVIHEANRQLATKSTVFIDTSGTDLPLTGGLTTQHMIDAKGGELLLISVGIQSATLPTIANLGGTVSPYKTGESFRICNFNESSDININVPAGYQQAIGSPLNVNDGTVTIPAGTTVQFTAVDGTSYGTWGKKTWVAREIVN